MKRILTVLVFSFVMGGCMFQRPDYLIMLTPVELNKIMQTQDILLVDVHIPEQQHIKGTDLFIPYNEIEKYQDKLPKDKKTAIYLYCRSDSMANAAARVLHELGYEDLSNLEGGANAWRQAGLAFE
jgi:rhodanese-related sulfurtransferase